MHAILDDDDPSLFPKLAAEQLTLLARYGQVKPIQVGDVLFREGDTAYDLMVLLEGRVAVVVGSGDAQRQLVCHRPGDVMADLSILTREPVHAAGVVKEPGSMLVVPAEEFRALLGRELAFGDFILQTLFRRRQAVARLRLGIQIVGSRFDADTHRLREFAARNRVLHDWLDVDDPRGQQLFGELGIESPTGPIVVLGSGAFLRNPTNAELADAIGLAHHRPDAAEDTYDLVVIGAGPAGLAASVYGASSGLLTAMLDAVAVGGQAATSARIENYLGFPAGLSGAELAERARFQVEKFRAHIMVPCRAVGLTERDGFHVVALEAGNELLARSVILALGVQYRRLPVPRIAEYEGLGVTHAADAAWEQLRPGDAAVVVGGANSAGQAALSLADDGRHVYLVVRTQGFERLAGYLRDRIAHNGNVEVLFGHQVCEVGGAAHLEQVTVQDAISGARRVLEAGALVVLIGAEPRTEWLAGAVALDQEGYILVGPALPPGIHNGTPWDTLGRPPFLLETSRPGVFAVGDVRSGSTKMVAPAVGEGGMAVRFAAEYLSRSSSRARTR